jgi:hypothetical protein
MAFTTASMTLGQCCAEWLALNKPRFRPSTFQFWNYAFRKVRASAAMTDVPMISSRVTSPTSFAAGDGFLSSATILLHGLSRRNPSLFMSENYFGKGFVLSPLTRRRLIHVNCYTAQ